MPPMLPPVDGMEYFDAEQVEQRALGADHVVNRDDGEFHGVGPAGGGIGGAWAGRAFAAAEDIGADE